MISNITILHLAFDLRLLTLLDIGLLSNLLQLRKLHHYINYKQKSLLF